ncbi:glutamate--tRNA ligase [Flaviflagellibacter deserti]|uniref:Glutamate--tRNA ligase n=1 Tax=Flaviflagellibacter deserti TaxID=2267266 RepID=A0ABV9Z1A6_9HYPH
MSDPVVVRFAPSPTGFLHIGGARTALFNWLFAKSKGGKMLLRIEDTDRARSTQEAIDAILDGLTWLGLDWDGDPVFQFSRADRHREVVDQLLATGKAYRAYDTVEELDAMRANALAAGKPPRYDGGWRDRDPSEAPADIAPVIRLRVENAGDTVVEDAVQGTVTFPNADLDDLVLLRSDGTPTYMLAVVIDDHDMGITDVIRGVDHLTNAARQIQIYNALGWKVPHMAHIPLIHGPDGAKLSKRHGALGVEAYREMGYMPAALRNYLVRLGWSHKDQEIFSTEEMIAAFGLDAVGRSPSRFDYDRLENLNGHYVRATPDDELVEQFAAALPYLQGGPAAKAKLDAGLWDSFRAALPSMKERSKNFNELLDNASFLLVDRPLALDDKAQQALSQPGTRDLLKRLTERLRALDTWSAEEAESAVREFATAEGAKLGQVAQPLRAATTGKMVSPPIFEVLAILGRDESLARLADQAV